MDKTLCKDGPPAAPLLDAVECWLPNDEEIAGVPVVGELSGTTFGGDLRAYSSQSTHRSCGSHVRGTCPSKPAFAQPALVAGVQDVIEQRCKELGCYLEDRLNAHHESLFQRLSEELKPGPSVMPMPSVLRDLHGPGRESGSSQASPRGGESIESKNDAGGEDDLTLYDFENAEQQKIQRSKMVTGPRILADFALGEMKENPKKWILTLPRRLQECVSSSAFETGVCALILVNVFFLGIEVQYTLGMREEDIPLVFKSIEMLYTLIFATELTLRFLGTGIRGFFCDEAVVWNVTDIVLMAISLVQILMDVLLEVSPNLEYARVLRMARTVRVLRVVRIVKFFRPLRILVYSIANTLRSVFWTLVLLGLIIYLFGLIFTMAVSGALTDFETGPDSTLTQYFGSLTASFTSLFQAITGGMDWTSCSDALATLNYFWSVLFIAYIAFTQFAILNVVTGVVCQTAIESARQDQDIVVQAQLQSQNHYVKQFEALFNKFDADRSGCITLQEFEEKLEDPTLQAYFQAMEITIDEAWNLFKLLDNHETCMININEFVGGCLKLRGSARSIDVHMLMYQSRWTMKKLAHVCVAMEEMQNMLYGNRRPKKQGPDAKLKHAHGNKSMSDVTESWFPRS